jgi:hypothetical protein
MVTSQFLGVSEDPRSLNGIAYVWRFQWEGGEPVKTRILARDPQGADSWMLADSAQPAAAVIAQSIAGGSHPSPFYWVSGPTLTNGDGSQSWAPHDRSEPARGAAPALPQFEPEPLTTGPTPAATHGFRPDDRVMVQGDQFGVVKRIDEYTTGTVIVHVLLDQTPLLGTQPFVPSDLQRLN